MKQGTTGSECMESLRKVCTDALWRRPAASGQPITTISLRFTVATLVLVEFTSHVSCVLDRMPDRIRNGGSYMSTLKREDGVDGDAFRHRH